MRSRDDGLDAALGGGATIERHAWWRQQKKAWRQWFGGRPWRARRALGPVPAFRPRIVHDSREGARER